MKKFNFVLFLFLLLSGLQVQAQTSSDSLLSEKNILSRHSYRQLEFSIPLVYDLSNSPDDDAARSILPAGINALIGYGYDYKKVLGLGFHSGLTTRWDEQLVAVPIFLNFRASPKISKNAFLSLQAGYGKSFALGRGDASGDYKRVNIGVGSMDEIIQGAIFIEYTQMDFPVHEREKIEALSLGVTFFFF
ncbi:hypothetical protein [Flavobacterium pedocola]